MTAPDAPGLAPAVTAALRGLQGSEKDSGAVRLAEVYAKAIDDDPAQLVKLGPGLLSVLESLGLTPKARAALVGRGGGDAPARNRLDELRDRRRARVDNA